MSAREGLACDVLVVGGGSAGLAAAVSAAESGAQDVLVVEREGYLGGVLPQCVHDGFGLHLYGKSLTGPEYATRWIDRARAAGVRTACMTTVTRLEQGEDGFTAEVVGAHIGGIATICARTVVVATGCRERTRGALQIPGGRPAGVITAGTAQYMVNVANQMPGDKVVILGSGDIGLIMARRMTLEGAQVRLVLGQEATGLVRNHISCIQDFHIPIRYGWGLASIHGYGQLQGVTVAPMDEKGVLDLARREYVRCNVLLLACGLIPEREVLEAFDAPERQRGLFVCGNARKPHDLVDQVSQEGIRAGRAAAALLADARGSAPDKLPDDLEHMSRLTIREARGRMNETHRALPEGASRVVCTVCPTGCIMEVPADGAVSGNGCARGEAFAHEEVACPRRLFTGTVRLEGAGPHPLVAVRTSEPVAREMLAAVARCCAKLVVAAPVVPGDVIAEDVAGTGAQLVATDAVSVEAHG